jgi:hypothetical protein
MGAGGLTLVQARKTKKEGNKNFTGKVNLD